MAALLVGLFVTTGGCARWDFEQVGGVEALGPGIVLSAPTCGAGCDGGTCAPCAPVLACDAGNGTCLASSCTDGAQNGGETARDCGGPCGATCEDGEGCALSGDCASGACDGSVCVSCQDAVQNRDETDVDCGGSTCAPCPDDAGCDAGTDCASGLCGGNVCRAPTCSDGVQDQDETSVDCGGVCGATCSVLQSALVHRYRFNGTGTTITDSVGGADGVLVNTSLSGSGSVSLAGGSSVQYVDLPNGIVSSLVDASFEAWLTWDGGQGWQKIFDFGTNTGGEGNQSTLGQYFLTMSPKRALLDEALLMRNCPESDCSSAAQWIEAAAASTLAAGVQKHVVGVFDDTGNEMRIYVDGSRVASQANGRSLSELDDVNNWLGRSQYVGDPDYAGQLHEFRIYNRALSDAEVLASYEAGPDPGFL